jgi:hypothetical protein
MAEWAQTPYAETELLLAVMNGDEKRAVELARGFNASEANQLLKHLDRASDLVCLHAAKQEASG